MNTLSDERGFTLIELMVVMVIMVPLFGALANVSSSVTKTVEANDKNATGVESVRRTVQRLSQLLRPARLSSVQVLANADDVALGRAAIVGEWISPTDLEPRSGLRFLAAGGLLSMNAALSTPQRELTFELENGETSNGADDDGDGLIDEGVLVFRSDVGAVSLGRFEMCQFALDGSVLRVSLRAAVSDSQRNVYRTSVTQSFYIRNT